MARQTAGTLSRGRVVSYAMGDVANNISFGLTSMFLAVYMTDIAGVPAAMAGTIYGVTKIFAGITDLVAGNTVDKFDTRWGRLRPWVLFGSLPLLAVLVLLFSTPAGLGATKAVAWILLFDCAFQLFYSFVNIPYGSLSSAMTQDSTDRSRLSGARSIASSVTSVLLAFAVAPQFQDTTADNIRQKFTITMLALAVVAAVLYFICFANTREVVPRAPGRMNLGKTLTVVRQNKPLLILCAGALFMLGSMFTMNAVGMYYARDVLGHASWFAYLSLAFAIGTILVASILPRLGLAFGKRRSYMMLALIGILGYLVVYFTPNGTLAGALLGWFLYGGGIGGTNAMMFSMQADTVDYGEWKTGIRSEGGSYSILSFIRKCGQGAGGALGLAVVGAFGYVAKAPSQSAQALDGIRTAAGLLPAVLALVAVVIMAFYPLTETAHRELVAELGARRTRRAAGAALGVDDDELVIPSRGDGRVMRVTTERRPIVTIFEREGAGATDIAPKVAQALGVSFLDQAFSSDELARVDSQSVATETGFDRFVRSVSYSAIQNAELNSALDKAQDNRMADEVTRGVLAGVEDGGVVLGRNGAFILHQAGGSFHVRLTAPIEQRIQRVIDKTGLDRPAALARIRTEERLRAGLSHRFFGWDPYEDDYYDLVINTGSMTYDQVVDVIVSAYRGKYASTNPPTPHP